MKHTYFNIGQHLIFNNIYYQIFSISHEEIILKEVGNLQELKLALNEAERLLRLGTIKFIEEGSILTDEGRVFSLISESQREEVLRRYEYVKAAQKEYPWPQRVGLEELIVRVANNIDDCSPPSSLTLYRWWKKWEESGHQLYSLENKPDGKKGYRKYKETIGDIFYEVVNEIYLTKERQSKQEVYFSLISRIKHYNHVMKTTIESPSRATVYRMIGELDDYTVMAERHGIKAANKYYRISGKGIRTTYPLERVEIDHTPLDVMVLDERTGLVIGRPYLTCLLDSHTRMPLAVSIGFEPPSELSVVRALKQAIWGKDDLIKNVPDIKGEWPAFGIPALLVCDNGLEFHSAHLRRICGELNIELMFCPKHEPNYKGRVERFLGTLNGQVSQRIRGTTFSNIRERGDYNSISEATITLLELQNIIYFWIVDIYLQTVHGTLGTTPYQQWIKNIQRVPAILPKDRDQFNLICAKQYDRSMSHEGIHFKRLTYNSESLRMLRILYGNRAKVQIRVDPENIEKIWVYDQGNDVFIEVPCTDGEYAKNLTLLQQEMVLKERLEQQKIVEEETVNSLREAKIKLNEKLKSLSSSKGIKKRSQAVRIGDINTFNIEAVPLKKINKKSPRFLLDKIPDFKLLGDKEEDNE